MPNTNADFGYGVNVTTCHSHFVCPEVSKSVISPAGLFFRATSRLLPSTLKALIFLVFPMLRFTVARRCVEDAWRCVGLQWYRTWRANPEEDTTPHTRGTPDPEGEAPKSSRQDRRASRSEGYGHSSRMASICGICTCNGRFPCTHEGCRFISPGPVGPVLGVHQICLHGHVSQVWLRC
jgi:hypothetical protein